MNRNELRKADINLMVVFEALMLERNVTRVAEKLFLGQPTISSALNRLRTLFNDPLFIRVGHRMEPTARAEEIIQHLSPALDSLSSALSLTHDFDPTQSTMTFRIGLSDDVEFGLLPPLLRALRQEAPLVVFVVQHVDYWRIPDLLASGDITVGIPPNPAPTPPRQPRKYARDRQHSDAEDETRPIRPGEKYLFQSTEDTLPKQLKTLMQAAADLLAIERKDLQLTIRNLEAMLRESVKSQRREERRKVKVQEWESWREEERGAMRGRARPRKGGVTLSEERKRVLEYIKHAQGGKERIAISREEDKGGKCGERARWADSPIEKCSMSRGRCARCAARIVEVRGCLGWKGGRKEQVSWVTVGRVVEGERPTHTALSYEEHSDRGTLAAWRIMGCVRCCLGARRVVRGQERFVRCRRGREICERRTAEERGGGDIRARLSSGLAV